MPRGVTPTNEPRAGQQQGRQQPWRPWHLRRRIRTDEDREHVGEHQRTGDAGQAGTAGSTLGLGGAAGLSPNGNGQNASQGAGDTFGGGGGGGGNNGGLAGLSAALNTGGGGGGGGSNLLTAPSGFSLMGVSNGVGSNGGASNASVTLPF